VKSKSFGCPNKACVNFLSLRNGPHKADAVDEAATVAMAELSECLQQEDENGHRIVGLRYRADVSALKDAVTLLRASNLSLGSIMFLAGFLHILYWSWPTMTAVTMLLECTASNQIRCWCKLDRAKAKCYLMDVGKRLHDLYDKVCCHQGRSLMLRSHKRKRTGAFPNPTMNPMMRRGSRQQWQHLVDDVKTGAWQNMCQSAAVLIEESIGSNGIKVCYKTLFDTMARFDSTLYSASWTASASHYNTVHFIRTFMFAMDLHSDQSSADWDLLSTMGTGVRDSSIPVKTHAVATYCARRISLELGEPYGIEDLCCFLCMLKKRDG
jgi:hypothetical protein